MADMMIGEQGQNQGAWGQDQEEQGSEPGEPRSGHGLQDGTMKVGIC